MIEAEAEAPPLWLRPMKCIHSFIHSFIWLRPPAGLLTLARALDYEVHREYYISIEGTRGRAGLGDSTMVIVNVTDVNDNVPVFQRATYSAHVPESLTPGNAVLQVHSHTP